MAKITNKWVVVIIVILVIIMMQGKKEAGESSLRSFESNVYANQETTVSIAVNPGTSTYLLIDEVVPSGWTVTSASDSGDYTTNAGHIFWTILSGATSKTYTYMANPGADLGIKTFTGTIGFEFLDEGPIGGETSVEVISPSCTPATEDVDCPTDTDCRNHYCNVDICAFTNINQGGACDAGTGTCDAGSCIAGAECIEDAECTDPPECRATASAACVSYACYYPTFAADGTSCTGGTCQSGSCEPTQICSEAGGACKSSACSSYDSCAALTGACASGYCCSGACTTSTPDCEFYQTLKDGECKTAGWVYIIFIFMAMMFFMKSMG